MQFRTVLKAQKVSIDIGHSDFILGIGSCFVENIGQRLHELQFPTLLNPFGIVYNPISIFKSLDYLLSQYTFTHSDIFEHNHLWHSWEHHSQFSQPQQDGILSQINQTAQEAQLFCKKATRLVLTFGTSFAYIHKDTGKIVANCHKVPPQYFEKKMLTVDEILEAFGIMFQRLIRENPHIQVILTVSPIRHIRDGIIENQRSKAILLLCINELCKKYPQVHYFPAYEIMMDDLRDYRFYEADMIHPNGQAIDYIWQFFKETYFSPATHTITDEVQKVNLMRQHRPLHPDTEGYQKFVQSLNEKIKILEDKYPFIRF